MALPNLTQKIRNRIIIFWCHIFKWETSNIHFSYLYQYWRHILQCFFVSLSVNIIRFLLKRRENTQTGYTSKKVHITFIQFSEEWGGAHYYDEPILHMTLAAKCCHPFGGMSTMSFPYIPIYLENYSEESELIHFQDKALLHCSWSPASHLILHTGIFRVWWSSSLAWCKITLILNLLALYFCTKRSQQVLEFCLKDEQSEVASFYTYSSYWSKCKRSGTRNT